MVPPRAKPGELPTIPEGGAVPGACVIRRSGYKLGEPGGCTMLAAERQMRAKIYWTVFRLAAGVSWLGLLSLHYH